MAAVKKIIKISRYLAQNYFKNRSGKTPAYILIYFVAQIAQFSRCAPLT